MVQAVPEIKYCEMSDGANALDKWEADSRGQDVYPGVYLLRPKYSPRRSRSGIMLCVFSYQFRVGVQRHNDNAASANSALNEAETYAAKIQSNMLHWAETHYGGIMKEYIYQNELYEPMRLTELDPDYVWGYEVSGQVGIPVHDLGLFC